jgi:hypothetical protein
MSPIMSLISPSIDEVTLCVMELKKDTIEVAVGVESAEVVVVGIKLRPRVEVLS